MALALATPVARAATFTGFALPGVCCTAARGVSADGSVVVGDGLSEAFRWTASTGIENLGSLPGSGRTVVRGVSADGSVVVGSAISPDVPVRWTSSSGFTSLGFAGAGPGVSSDGTVVVGHAVGPSAIEAFRWTPEGGAIGLGVLPGQTYSDALDLSADGSVVVGESGGEAFLWTSNAGMLGLGVLPGGFGATR